MTKGILLLLFVACSTLYAFADEEDVEPATAALPIGVVHEGAVYTTRTSLSFYRGDLAGKDVRVWQFCPFLRSGTTEESIDFSPRMKLNHGELVLVNASPAPGPRRREIATFAMPLAAIAERVTSIKAYGPPNENDYPEDERIESSSPDDVVRNSNRRNVLDLMYEAVRRFVNRRDKVAEKENPFSNYEFFYDVVPGKGHQWDFVVIASESLQEEIELTRKRTIVSVSCDDQWEKAKNPLKPMLGIWHNDDYGQWALIEKIKDPCFNERFQVFVQGTTYFFVTDSGKIYLAKKPAQGDRTIEEVWKKADQPITGALTDTASGKTFLFGQKGKVGAKDPKPFYFELAEKPDLVEFEEKVLVREKVPEPLQTVKAYAHLLAADKKIKIEPKPDPKP